MDRSARPLTDAELAELQQGAPAAQPPWRKLAALFIPAAALAAGLGAQRLLEGAEPAGDSLARWLAFSAVAGLVVGAIAGQVLSGRAAVRALWAAYGVASPFLVALAVLGAIALARPVRAWSAERKAQACRAAGRAVCSANEFRAACAEGAAPLAGAKDRAAQRLGAPARERCDANGCTYRWIYDGPWTPDSYVAPGSLLCSVVTDAGGRGVRHSVLPGGEAP